MPIFDWQCPDCGAQVFDRYEPRLKATPPECPEKVLNFRGAPIVDDRPHIMERLWSTSHSHKPFKPFQVEVDGAVRQFNSLSEVRNYEKVTTQRGSPSIFRMFSQDSSNMDTNSLGEQKFQKPRTRNRRGQPFVVRKS